MTGYVYGASREGTRPMVPEDQWTFWDAYERANRRANRQYEKDTRTIDWRYNPTGTMRSSA